MSSDLTQAVVRALSAEERNELRQVLLRAAAGSELESIELPHSRSRMVAANGGMLYVSVYAQLSGLFSKRDSRAWTARVGRILCDHVAETMRARSFVGNAGFFTSDELPCCGLSRPESRKLRCLGVDQERALAVFFAYARADSQATKRTLDDALATLRVTLA